MSTVTCLTEFRESWLPHMPYLALQRLHQLLADASPLLIHGMFESFPPRGCIATHIAWNHPETQAFIEDAGIVWLTRIAKLNPATSLVIQAWDNADANRDDLRIALMHEIELEQQLRLQHPVEELSESCCSGFSNQR